MNQPGVIQSALVEAASLHKGTRILIDPTLASICRKQSDLQGQAGVLQEDVTAWSKTVRVRFDGGKAGRVEVEAIRPTVSMTTEHAGVMSSGGEEEAGGVGHGTSDKKEARGNGRPTRGSRRSSNSATSSVSSSLDSDVPPLPPLVRRTSSRGAQPPIPMDEEERSETSGEPGGGRKGREENAASEAPGTGNSEAEGKAPKTERGSPTGSCSSHVSSRSGPGNGTHRGEKVEKGTTKLTELDPETWVGRRVQFTQASGPRSKGLGGRVLRAGGGWVTVQVEGKGEVSGRAYNIVAVEETGGGERGEDGEGALRAREGRRGGGGEEEKGEHRAQPEGEEEGGGRGGERGGGESVGPKMFPRANSPDDEEEQEEVKEGGREGGKEEGMAPVLSSGGVKEVEAVGSPSAGQGEKKYEEVDEGGREGGVKGRRGRSTGRGLTAGAPASFPVVEKAGGREEDRGRAAARGKHGMLEESDGSEVEDGEEEEDEEKEVGGENLEKKEKEENGCGAEEERVEESRARGSPTAAAALFSTSSASSVASSPPEGEVSPASPPPIGFAAGDKEDVGQGTEAGGAQPGGPAPVKKRAKGRPKKVVGQGGRTGEGGGGEGGVEGLALLAGSSSQLARVPLRQVELHAEAIKRHVERHWERFKDRPDPRSWLEEMHDVCDTDSEREDEEEYRDVLALESRCCCLWCHAEKALEDTYCWNVACPASPLFSERAALPMPGGGASPAPPSLPVPAHWMSSAAGVQKIIKRKRAVAEEEALLPYTPAEAAALKAHPLGHAHSPPAYASIGERRRVKRLKGSDHSRFAEGKKVMPACGFLAHAPVHPQGHVLFNTHAYVKFLEGKAIPTGEGRKRMGEGEELGARRGGGRGERRGCRASFSLDPALYRWQVAEAARQEQEAQEAAAKAAEAAAKAAASAAAEARALYVEEQQRIRSAMVVEAAALAPREATAAAALVGSGICMPGGPSVGGSLAAIRAVWTNVDNGEKGEKDKGGKARNGQVALEENKGEEQEQARRPKKPGGGDEEEAGNRGSTRIPEPGTGERGPERGLVAGREDSGRMHEPTPVVASPVLDNLLTLEGGMTSPPATAEVLAKAQGIRPTGEKVGAAKIECPEAQAGGCPMTAAPASWAGLSMDRVGCVEGQSGPYKEQQQV